MKCKIDTDAESYNSHSPKNVLAAVKDEKERKKDQGACEERRYLFTPLCVAVDGMLGREANLLLFLSLSIRAYTLRT